GDASCARRREDEERERGCPPARPGGERDERRRDREADACRRRVEQPLREPAARDHHEVRERQEERERDGEAETDGRAPPEKDGRERQGGREEGEAERRAGKGGELHRRQ